MDPKTNGRILIKTTMGPIDVELWTREAPKTCRNFIQLCLNNIYNGTIFHRLIKKFIIQGGDPTNTGEGGVSAFEDLKLELNQRLRFNRRGLLAMADSQSQFFFTLGACEELNGKHTIFGKIVGDTLYNVVEMGELETDVNDRPYSAPKILEIEVVENPFPELKPQLTNLEETFVEEKQKPAKILLSFEDEQVRGLVKSTHDVLNHPKLSSTCAEIKVEPKQEIKEEIKEVVVVEEKKEKKIKKKHMEGVKQWQKERSSYITKNKNINIMESIKKFRTKLKDAQNQPQEEQKEEEGEECLLHSVKKCMSCFDYFGHSEEQNDEGWMRHRVCFKEKRKREEDLYTVVDPRDRMAMVQSTMKKKR